MTALRSHRAWNVPHQLWMGVDEKVTLGSMTQRTATLSIFTRGLPDEDDETALVVSHRATVTWTDATGKEYVS